MLIIDALFVLAGPLWMFPLALAAKSWPHTAGRVLFAGAICAAVLAVHPWGLAYADYHLYTNVWVAVLGVSLVTAAIGAALVTVGRRSTAWFEVLGIAGAAIVATIAVTSAAERRDASVRWSTTYPVNFLAFAPDGRSLIAAGAYAGSNAHWDRYGGPSVSVVNATTGQVSVLAEGTAEHVLTADRRTLIAIKNSNFEILLWDTGTWTRRATVDSKGYKAFLSRGLLVITKHDSILLIDLNDGQTRGTIEYATGKRPTWVAVAPDGTTLAAGAWPQGDDALLWDVATLRSQPMPVTGTEPITRAQFSPDGALLAMHAEADGIARLHLWSLKNSRAVASLDEDVFWHSSWFAPDGRSLATRDVASKAAGTPGEMWSLWDTATWRKKVSVRGSGQVLAWSPDSRMVATLGYSSARRRSTVVLSSVSDGRSLATFDLDFLPATLDFSPDGTLVTVAGEGEIVHGWYKSGRIAVFPAVSPYGKAP
jgi:WD40 repeat protein